MLNGIPKLGVVRPNLHRISIAFGASEKVGEGFFQERVRAAARRWAAPV